MIQIIPLKMKATLKRQSDIRTDSIIYTQDKNSAYFKVALDTEMDSVTVLFKGDDFAVPVEAEKQGVEESEWTDSVTQELGGKVPPRTHDWLAEFDHKWISKYDDVEAYVYSKKGDKSYDLGVGRFSVGVSAIDNVVPKVKEYYFETLEDIVGEFEDWVKDYRGTIDEGYITELMAARDGESDLPKRLERDKDEVTAQLAQTKYEAKRKRKLEDLDSEVLSAIDGGEGTSFNLLSEPQNESVNPVKLSQEVLLNNYTLNNFYNMFEMGQYQGSSGMKGSNNHTVRTKERLMVKEGESLSVPEDYKFYLYGYDDDGSYLGASYDWNTGYYNFPKDSIVNLAIRKQDNSILTVSEVEFLVMLLTPKKTELEMIKHLIEHGYSELDFVNGALESGRGSASRYIDDTRCINPNFVELKTGDVIEADEGFGFWVYSYDVVSREYVELIDREKTREFKATEQMLIKIAIEKDDLSPLSPKVTKESVRIIPKLAITQKSIHDVEATKVDRVIQESDGKYTAWAHENSFEHKGKFYQLYTSGTNHGSGESKIYMRCLDYRNEKYFSDRILVADRTDEDMYLILLGSGVAPNGDFVAIVEGRKNGNKSFHHYRSGDEGVTWEYQGLLTINNFTDTPNHVMSWFVTDENTILKSVNQRVSPYFFFIRSTDNGHTWEKIDVENSYGNALSATFVQLPDGTIVSLLRRSTGALQTPQGSLYTVSHDDGLTWEPIKETDMVDMTSQNGSMVYHPEIDEVEVVWGSRLAQSDGFGSLYRSFVTPEDIKKGIFGVPERIKKGHASTDFGYPSLVKTADGRKFLSWYDRYDYYDGSKGTAIYIDKW